MKWQQIIGHRTLTREFVKYWLKEDYQFPPTLRGWRQWIERLRERWDERHDLFAPVSWDARNNQEDSLIETLFRFAMLTDMQKKQIMKYIENKSKEDDPRDD
jgi:hypothetical protein